MNLLLLIVTILIIGGTYATWLSAARIGGSDRNAWPLLFLWLGGFAFGAALTATAIVTVLFSAD